MCRAFEISVAPAMTSTVMIVPTTTGTWPCDARNRRDMLSTQITIASTTTIGVTSGST